MLGVTGAHSGRKRHARFVEEANYGQVPGGPGWQPVPYLGDGFTVAATSEPYEPDTNYSDSIDPEVVIMHKQDVAGDLTTLLWPQFLGALLDAALLRDANDALASFAWQHYTPLECRQYVGCGVQTLKLQANRTAEADAQLTLTWLGQQETVVTGVVAGDFDYSAIDERPFMGCDVAQIQVDGASSFDVEQFTLTVENALEPGPYYPKGSAAQRVINYIECRSARKISLDLTRLNRNTQFQAARRAASSLSFYARFTHPLGHVFELRLPRLIVPKPSEDGTPSKTAREAPTLLARKPAGGEAIEYGVDLAAGGATTVGGFTTTAAPTTAAPTTTPGV